MAQFTTELIRRVSKLANLVLTQKEEEIFLPQLSAILEFVSKLQSYDTTKTNSTAQVTGLANVFREDEVDTPRILTQKQALANAPDSYNGFVKVPSVFE